MKFVFFNETGREVSIHPATKNYGIKCNMNPIEPLKKRIFYLPVETYPKLKLLDNGKERGLSILVTPEIDIKYLGEDTRVDDLLDEIFNNSDRIRGED